MNTHTWASLSLFFGGACGGAALCLALTILQALNGLRYPPRGGDVGARRRVSGT